MSEESKQEIMDATYKAMCRHGYADLSIQKIADEFDKGKSLIYYHYDDKQELMLAFLDHLKDEIENEFQDLEGDSADDKLEEMFDKSLGIEEDEMWEFRRSLLEIRAQAPYNPEFSEKLSKIDQALEERFEDLLREKGVENPEIMADLLLSAIDGAMNRKITLQEREELEEVKQTLKQLIRNWCGCQETQ